MKISLAIIVLLFLESCATTRAIAPAAPTPLAGLKAQIMSADYRADIDALARLRDETAKYGDDPSNGYLAHYWSGFASWRMAINGANHQMKAEDLKANLQNAAAEFYQTMRMRNDFADAYAAADMVNGWLATFSLGAHPDMPAVRERVALSRALYARAEAIDPRSPRVLWAKGSALLFLPQSHGGDIAKAIDVYKNMLEESDRRGVNPASPLPDWGKAEALMSLAYAHSKTSPPDLPTALAEANSALKVQPDWSYVRDNLIPQIEATMRSSASSR